MDDKLRAAVRDALMPYSDLGWSEPNANVEVSILDAVVSAVRPLIREIEARHAVAKAFHDLAVKERDHARWRVAELQADIVRLELALADLQRG